MKRKKTKKHEAPKVSKFVGRMINAVPVWVEGEPKISGLYIAGCFGNEKRDVLTRLGTPDTHTIIGNEPRTRTMDNLYFFDADAKPGEHKWQNATGFYDGAVTHYLDFEVTYNITEEEAAKLLKDKKSWAM